jgi:hypothetical protein
LGKERNSQGEYETKIKDDAEDPHAIRRRMHYDLQFLNKRGVTI